MQWEVAGRSFIIGEQWDGNGGTVLKDTASLPPEYFHCEVGSQVVPGGVASVTKFDDFT